MQLGNAGVVCKLLHVDISYHEPQYSSSIENYNNYNNSKPHPKSHACFSASALSRSTLDSLLMASPSCGTPCIAFAPLSWK